MDDGILIVHGRDNVIGSALNGGNLTDGNVISWNGHGAIQPGDGVQIVYSSGNTILSNLMYSNANRGIAIYDNISQSWDPGDTDDGPNGLQNAPYVDMNWVPQNNNPNNYIWTIQGSPGATCSLGLCYRPEP